MMTLFTSTRIPKAYYYMAILLGLLPKIAVAQLTCPTIMPRSIPLSICSQADSLSFVYTNNNPNQRVGMAKATIDLPYGTKIRYRAGSVKGTSSAGLIMENNVSDLNKPIFTIPIPQYLEGVTVTFAVDVSCEALDLAQATLPTFKTTLDYTNAFQPAANPLTEQTLSEPFNINNGILAITPDQMGRSVIRNTTFTRCFHIKNTGYGGIDPIYITDTTMSGTSFLSATAGGQAFNVVSTTDIMWQGQPAKVRKFLISGIAFGSDRVLSPNEGFDFCQTMKMNECGSFKTQLIAEYKCTPSGMPCSIAAASTSMDTDVGNPELVATVVQYEKPNGCALRHAQIRVKNDGTGAVGLTGLALNVGLVVGFLSDNNGTALMGPYSSDVPLSNLKINGISVPTTLWSNSYPNGAHKINFSNFIADPDGAGGLSDLDNDGQFDDLALQDSLILEYDYAPDYLIGKANCSDGFERREAVVKMEYDWICNILHEESSNNLFYYRNMLLQEGTQISEPTITTYPVTNVFTYQYNRAMEGYDLTGATGTFKISDPDEFDFATPRGITINNVFYAGSLANDTLTVNVPNVASILNGVKTLKVSMINKCPYDHIAQSFIISFELNYASCGTKAHPHCPRLMTYNGGWGCGAGCYTFWTGDPWDIAHDRITSGYTNATEVTAVNNNVARHYVGDRIFYSNRVTSYDVNGNGVDRTSINPNNIAPYTWIQLKMPYVTSGAAENQLYYPTLDEAVENPPYLLETARIYATDGTTTLNWCTLTLPNTHYVSVMNNYMLIRKDSEWPNTYAQSPNSIKFNYRDTVVNRINYSIFTDAYGVNRAYIMRYFIGVSSDCPRPAALNWRNNSDFRCQAWLRINPDYKVTPYPPYTENNTFPEYYTYPNSEILTKGYMVDHLNVLGFYAERGGGVCQWKAPARSLINPRMSIKSAKKHYQAGCSLQVEHEMGYGGIAGDAFASEFRAPWKIDTLKVELPAGYQYKAGTAQIYYEQNQVGTYAAIANPPTNTGTILFINPGTWPLTDDASGFRTGYKIRYTIEPTAPQTGQVFAMPYQYSIRRRNITTSTAILKDTFTLADKIPTFATTTHSVERLDNKHCVSTKYIDIRISNTSDVGMLNPYLAVEGSTGVTIDSVKNILNGSPLINAPLTSQSIVAASVYGSNDQFIKLGTLAASKIAVFRVYYKSATCHSDTILGHVDWGCSYPAAAQPNLSSTSLQTVTSYIHFGQPGLQASLIYNNTEITLCDDVTYELEFKNTQLSDAYNVNLKAMLPPGMRYIANSAQFKLPANAGAYTNFSAGNITIVNAGTSDSLVLKLNQFDSPTNICGLKTAADTANSKIRVQFKANYTTCPPPMSTRTAKFYTSATNFCQDTTLLYNIVSKPIHFTDEDPVVRNTLACTVVSMPTINGSSASAQTLTCTFKVKNEGSGGTTVGKDSIQINLPKGFTYSSTANVSGLTLPTSPRIVNGSEGQTLMYLLPAGMAVGGESQFNLVVTTDPVQFNGRCNLNVPIAIRTLSYKSPVCVAKNLTCNGANSGCDIQGSAFDDANIFCCPVICLPVVARRN